MHRNDFRKVLGGLSASCALLLTALAGYAQPVYVNDFGSEGWQSDDTRNSGGANIVNATTHAPAPSVILDPDQVAAQINWLNLNGTRGNLGGLSLNGTTGSGGKSTISLMDTATGLGSTTATLGEDFSAAWLWTQTGSASQGAGLKIGIQSQAWGQSQEDFTATRSGEASWDLILVSGRAGSGTVYSTADYSTTVWSVYQQAGNTFFSDTPLVAAGTLEEIFSGSATMMTDKYDAAEFANLVFGGSAKVTNVQLGIGSGQANGNPVVDYAKVSFLNEGEMIDFVDASLWNNAAGGDLMNAANWSGTLVGPAQNGVFALDDTYTVNVTGTASVRSLGVGAGTVTLDVAPTALLQLQNDGYLSAEVGASLNVTGGEGSLVTGAAVEAWGNASLATAVNLDGGSVNHPTRQGRYAIVVGEGGTLNLESGADVTVVNESGAQGVKTLIRVGELTPDGGIGTLNIKAGSHLTAGSLSGTGSWTGIHVGDWGGEGVVNQTGGTVDLFGAVIIGNEGGVGTYTMSGDSLLNIYRPVADNGAIIVGRATSNRTAEGVFNIQSGTVVLGAAGGAAGNVSLLVGGLADNVAGYANAQGTVNQTGGEVRLTNGKLTFGRGQGTYNLDGGVLALGGTGGISTTPNGTYAFNFGGGTMRVINSNLTTSINASLAKGVSVIDTNGLNAAWSGSLTGSGTLNKAGEGTLSLSGNNNLTGQVYVIGGTLAQTAGNSEIKYLAVASGAGKEGDYLMTGGSLFSSQAIQVGDWGGVGSLTQTGGSITVGTLAAGASFNVGNQGGSGTYNLSGGSFTIVSGFANLGRSTQATAGTGTLNLSGSGTFTVGAIGGTDGDLIIGDRDDTNADGSGIVNQTGGLLRVLGGGELWVGAYGAGTYNLDGGVLEIGGNALKYNYGSAQGGYAFNLGGGTIRVSGSNLTTSIASNLKNGTANGNVATKIDTNGLNAAWSGAINGAQGGLVKVGTGTLTLSGGVQRTIGYLNTDEGTTVHASGTTAVTEFVVGSNYDVKNGNFVMEGGEILVTGSTPAAPTAASMRVGDWGGTGSFTQNGGRIVVGGPGQAAALNIGNQGGTGTYTLNSGTITVAGGNNVIGRSSSTNPKSTGALNINGGLFEIANGSAVINGDNDNVGDLGEGVITQTGGTLRANGTLYVSGFGEGTYNLNGGVLEAGGTSLQARYNNSTSTYALNLGNGTLKVINSDLVSAVDATLVTSSTWTLNTNGYDATWSGNLSGAGSMRKTGTGELTLSGSNSFTGALLINEGKLIAGSAHALGKGDVIVSAGSMVEVGAGVVLDIEEGSAMVLAADGISAYEKNFGNGETFANFGAVMSGATNATVAQLLNGNASSAGLAATATFSLNSTATNDEIRVSDILNLNGLDGETFVLQLSYSGMLVDEMSMRLAWFNGTEWVNAADGAFYAGAYGVVYDGLEVGTYGIDTANNVVWAVLDHNSDFAVIPEPTVCVLVGAGLAAMLFGRRRKLRA